MIWNMNSNFNSLPCVYICIGTSNNFDTASVFESHISMGKRGRIG